MTMTASIKSTRGTVDQTVDIAIVGAGIAGTALACALLDTGYRVALIEASNIPQQLPPAEDSVSGYDLRVSALTHASRILLEQLGVWESITACRASAYDHMTVWDGEGTGTIEFAAADVQQSALGHIVENRVVCAALMQRLRGQRAAANKVTVMDGVSVEKIHIETARHQGQDITETLLELSDGKTVRCQLLVGADGASSRVREALQIPLQVRPYGHTALVATVQTEHPHQHTAWQRFLTTGPLAFLPLSAAGASSNQADYLSSIVWSADTDYANELMALDDQAFAQRLAASFEYRLGRIEAVSKRLAFPLYQRHVTSYFRPGAVLVADAAHTIHPLAGQGINLGLADVAVLAEELKRAEGKGLLPADESVLRRYQRRRKSDTLLMIGAMAGFKHLFGHKALPVRWLRNTGLNRINELAPVKRLLIKQAMGIR